MVCIDLHIYGSSLDLAIIMQHPKVKDSELINANANVKFKKRSDGTRMFSFSIFEKYYSHLYVTYVGLEKCLAGLVLLLRSRITETCRSPITVKKVVTTCF